MKSAVRLLIPAGACLLIVFSYQNCGQFEVSGHLKGVEGSKGVSGKSVTVTFALSRSALVNSAGGGYRVYYAQGSEKLSKTSPSINVPYSAALKTSPKAKITGLSPGPYQIAISAYTTQTPLGTELSEPQMIVVKE